jgi:hypothetical protein
MSRQSLVWTALIIALIMGMLSCSERDNPIVPTGMTAGRSAVGCCLGAWRIVPADDLSSAEIVPMRVPQFDVTKWADVKILNAVWDPLLRNWTLTVQVANPTPWTGWGVRAIFTELGGKELRRPDGFLWLDLDQNPGEERYPFFAIEKTTPQREFVGLHVCVQDLVFHFPEGVEKWIPITFFIDAHLKGPRPDPMVEDLDMGYFPPPCLHATVTAHVQDHQSDASELAVWVDLTPIGGSNVEPMFDDGEHGDGLAGDGIFGAEFDGGVFGELYTLTVYARDPEANTAENDIAYSPIEYPPLPPLSFDSLMQGPLCLFTEERLEVIEDQQSWEQFWSEFSPWDMSAPEIDFGEKRVVAVCTGDRPNDCYSVSVTGVDWSSENCGWAVYYTETVPGEKCECNDVVISPFHLVTVGKAAFDIMFKGDIYVDECSDPQDPCLDLIPIADGTHGQQEMQTMSVITDEAGWDAWWKTNVGGGGQPNVDFDLYMLFAVTMGRRNTSGFYATIDSVCWDDTMELEAIVGWHIPGEGCMVLQVITYPYTVVAAEKVSAPVYWTTYDDVYKCD